MKNEFAVTTDLGPVSGILGFADAGAAKRKSLLVAIHGGTVTSKYFDVPGYSMVEAANTAGFDILAMDRPGYRDTARLEDCADMLHQNALRIAALLPKVLVELGLPVRDVILIGHSMGGVIATTLAALQPEWPLRAIAGSGFARFLPTFLKEGFAALPNEYFVEAPPGFEALIFGPPETLHSDMPAAARIIHSRIPRSELIDIGTGWADRAPGLAAQVTVPVYYKLAEHESLWDPRDMQSFADLYTSAPRVESGILEGMGHCCDFNKSGRLFQQELLAFAESVEADHL